VLLPRGRSYPTTLFWAKPRPFFNSLNQKLNLGETDLKASRWVQAPLPRQVAMGAQAPQVQHKNFRLTDEIHFRFAAMYR